MEYKKGQKRFWNCFRDFLGTTLIINQAAALIVAFILAINSGNKFFFILTLCILFSNCIGLSIHLVYSIFQYFRYSLFSEGHKRKLLLHILLTLSGMFVGSELAIFIDNTFLGYMNISFWSFLHLKILGGNFLVAGIFGIGGHSYVRVKKRLEQKIIENQKIKHLQTRSQLMALQSKINPHFLFNTLNTMLNLVYKSPGKVETMILNLSDIYRQVLRLPNNEGITIKEEGNIIREYLEIEKIRMGSRLDFTIYLDPQAANVKIPALLIEPIVENAVIHGISPKPAGGKIDIKITKAENIIEVKVQDNGTGFENNEPAFGFGLQSIRERLQLVYKEKAKLKITAPKDGGACIILEFPNDH
jgi:two-component system LytT family sensor kinase